MPDLPSTRRTEVNDDAGETERLRAEVERQQQEIARLNAEVDHWRSKAVDGWADRSAPDEDGPAPRPLVRRVLSKVAAIVRSRPRLDQMAGAFRAAMRARSPQARP